ncbi:Rv3654c family TadE-like protein [Rhodococcoides fascians]|jgi:secretion/DNA translocation related TadE-like protein|uniref:Rv3654c family TadE-like protein n=1 Tax=Rhodococcoides fascians TaxID=1828 RepID=UPI00055F8A2B|nr:MULTISPECIES: Rv3654c family TadE-like protein [Rhodococcus]OZE99905.1 pilus assembly protein TadE [Rhodococcus sp. 15-1189-1-1a]OZF12483.1 pilus assembly protein TadE [Rhodococcus sp. 14-2686-1-2]
MNAFARFESQDKGSVTVTAAFALTALLVVVIAVVHVGSAVGARHRAQSAADLAALAAAGALDRGVVDACATGRDVVERVGGSVSTCTVEGWDVVVEVTVSVTLGRLGIRDAVASARAGP